MSTRLHRSFAALGLAATLLAAPLTGCGSDDDDAAADTSEVVESTTSAADDSDGSDDSAEETTTTEAEEADETTTSETELAPSGEIGTTGVLDHLNAEAPEIGALFDWNTGDGVIGVNYLGVQTVQLYAVEIDAATALQACEVASSYVFSRDPEADIEVFTGGYSASVKVVSRNGEAGTCAAV